MEELSNVINETVEQVKTQIPDISELSISDWIYFLAAPILILMTAGMSFKLWLKTNVFLSFFFGGVMLFYPEALLSLTLNAEVDSQLRFISSLFGCYEIFSILFVYFLLPSKDESVFISYLWSNIIKFSLILNDNYISFVKSEEWNYKLLAISGSTAASMIITSIYFLLKSSQNRTQFQYKWYPINLFAKIDFYMLFMAGIFLFAYPIYVLEKLDFNNIHSGHESLFRVAGIVTMAMSFTSFGVPSFLFEKDKMRYVLARLSGGLLELLTIFYGYFFLKAITTKAFCILAGLNLFYDSFITFGYLCCVKKLEELKMKSGHLNVSGLLNDSDIIYAEITTNVVEEVVKVNPEIKSTETETETTKDK